MSDVLRHPGADPACARCHGLGLDVTRSGAWCAAVPCACTGACPACAGSGFVKVGNGFRAPVRTCACRLVARRAELFAHAQIPARYADATLTSFVPRKEAMPAFLAVNRVLKAAAPGEDLRGLVLYGEVGRGKTHLMVALLRELVLQHGRSGRFVEFSLLTADLRMSFGRGDTAELLDPLSAVQVLAVDELGKGRNSEFEGTVLDELVSRRYNAAATILGTTNYPPHAATGAAVPSLAAPHRPSLIDRVGDRVFSRLREMCDFVPVGGEDFREVGRGKAAARRG